MGPKLAECKHMQRKCGEGASEGTCADSHPTGEILAKPAPPLLLLLLRCLQLKGCALGMTGGGGVKGGERYLFLFQKCRS